MGVTPPRQRKVFSPEIDGIHKSFEPLKVSVVAIQSLEGMAGKSVHAHVSLR